ELHAKILDRGSLQRFERHHHELVGGLGLELGELLGERRARSLVQNAGIVHHPAAERGEVERERWKGQQECDESEKREPCSIPDRPVQVTCPLPTQDHAQPEPAGVALEKEHLGFGWSLWRHSEVSSGTHRTLCAIRILPAAAS